MLNKDSKGGLHGNDLLVVNTKLREERPDGRRIQPKVAHQTRQRVLAAASRRQMLRHATNYCY